MIQMMYLVYTAMLALNVSAEILNAFVVVDDTLVTSTNIAANQNANDYQWLLGQKTILGAKVEDAYNKSQILKKESDAMVKYIEKMRNELIFAVDGDSLVEKDGKMVAKSVADIVKKDNFDIPTDYMINNGHAKELKEQIKKYKANILKLAKPEDQKRLEEALGLNVDATYTKDMNTVSWEEHNFDHIISSASATLLNKIIGEVKNAESVMLNYLKASISADDFKFDNVTGRDELKEQLRKEVLFALQNPEKAKLYKLPAINGVLLYRPPGCAKSLVLESFAEELGFNYSIIKGVEMGHIYQDGVLDNLQRVFDAAEIKAPFVLCFDEIEFIAPNPNGEGEDSNITQQISALFGMMNNCSKKGILVVATTNRPDLIDQAIMRVGCFDRVFFVPQPDFEARKDIFIDHLKERPCEELDFDELAKMSDDFNAGDITEAVNEAAMTAAYNDVPISQKILVDVLKYKNPTYSTKTRIGFNKN